MSNYIIQPEVFKVVESYAVVELRIIQAVKMLKAGEAKGMKVNIAEAARNFFVPEGRLRARWNGVSSKLDLVPPNRKLSDA